MDPNSLLTTLALLIAIYAIIPPERKLDLKIRLGWFDYSIAALAVLLIHYILYYPVLNQIGLSLELGPWKFGFDPVNSSYLIIICSGIFIFFRAKNVSLKTSKLSVFQTLTEKLLQEQKYGDLLFLLERHYKKLFLIYNGDNFFVKLSKQYHRTPLNMIDYLGLDKTGSGGKLKLSKMMRIKLFMSSIYRLIGYLPIDNKSSFLATDIVRRVFLNEDFISYISRARPYFALNILIYKFEEKHDFLDIYIRGLLANRTSVIFYEILNNQNLDGLSGRYMLNDANRLICFFLKDAKQAESLAVFNPFGEFAIDYLDELQKSPITDNYNTYDEKYFEDNKWSCPLFVTIRFFEIMVTEAIYQNIQWHMWLYYMPIISERIIQNMQPISFDELYHEWPTRYHYLLYEIVSIQVTWIKSVLSVPITQSNVVLASVELAHENGNIPKSAIIALGQTFYSVMLSKIVSLKFKSYLLEIVISTISDLENNTLTVTWFNLLINSIKHGGRLGKKNDYIDNLRNAFHGMDTHSQMKWDHIKGKLF